MRKFLAGGLSLVLCSSPTLAAIDFDAADDVVTLASEAPTTQLTIACWLNVDSLGEGSAGHPFAIRDDADNDPNIQINTRATNAIRFLVVFQPGTEVGVWQTTNNTYVFGTWFHLAITYDGGALTNDPVIYINGSPVSFATDTNPPSGTYPLNATAWTIGSNAATTATFDGRVDDLRYYNRVLSAAEVATLANSRLRGTYIGDGLLHYWTLNDGEAGTSADGDRIIDHVGTNHGTGNDGANNTGLGWNGTSPASYPPTIRFP